MQKRETKTIIILLLLVALVLVMPSGSSATDYSSAAFKVKDPVIDEGLKSSSSNFGLGQSLDQTAIGKSTSLNFQLWSGFQYFFKVNANTLTPTPGSGQVSLSWTVPQTFLGISVSSYEVGTGTVSGSYVFQDVGNVTSFVKSGLTNGTPYFFKIKAKSAGGLFLVYSNEATSTPQAASPPPGGGGSPPPPPPQGATIILNGLASPGAAVFVLKDGSVAASTTADPGAAFGVTVSNLNTGIYNFTLYAEDIQGVRTSTTSFNESLTSGVTTTINNIFLSPSIGTDLVTVKKGDTITIFGYSVPSSNVSVFVNSNPITDHVVAAGSGAWVDAFNTTVLDIGDHTSRSQSAKNNLLSVYSTTVDFAVGDENIKKPPTCVRSDLNCDGRINLVDFSILLFFWNQSTPSNAAADINTDGIVDLTDMSILLFDWTG